MKLAISQSGLLWGGGLGDDGFAALLDGRTAIGPSPWDLPLAALGDVGRGTSLAFGSLRAISTLSRPGPRIMALVRRVLDGASIDGHGLAIVMATTSAAMRESEPAIEAWIRGRPVSADELLWNHLAYRPAQTIAAELGADGPVLTVSTACTSGTTAIGVAADLLRAGQCSRALVIGADALCTTTVHGFRSLGACTKTRCRPFDRGRDGMALGEGAAFVLLEAAPTGPHTELVGVATTSDAGHLTAPDPTGGGALRALRQALGDIPGDAIDHVNAHGTGTVPNDAAEALALAAGAPRAAVSATKGATGHLLGASGVIEAVFALRSMQAGLIPPVVGLEDPLPVDVAAKVRSREQRVVASLNLAFGGHNAAVVLRRVT